MERSNVFGHPRDFDWLDGTNVGETYSNFIDGEPDNQNGEEDCGVFFIAIDGKWRSQLCSYGRQYVCQRYTGKA